MAMTRKVHKVVVGRVREVELGAWERAAALDVVGLKRHGGVNANGIASQHTLSVRGVSTTLRTQHLVWRLGAAVHLMSATYTCEEPFPGNSMIKAGLTNVLRERSLIRWWPGGRARFGRPI